MFWRFSPALPNEVLQLTGGRNLVITHYLGNIDDCVGVTLGLFAKGYRADSRLVVIVDFHGDNRKYLLFFILRLIFISDMGEFEKLCQVTCKLGVPDESGL